MNTPWRKGPGGIYSRVVNGRAVNVQRGTGFWKDKYVVRVDGVVYPTLNSTTLSEAQCLADYEATVLGPRRST